MIADVQQALKEDGFSVTISKLCRWFEVPRRSHYYKKQRSVPKVQACFAEPIKALIEAEPMVG